MADIRTPGDDNRDDRDIIEALRSLGRAEAQAPNDITRQRHLRAMRRSRLARRPATWVAAAVAVAALIVGVAVVGGNDNANNQFAAAHADEQARNASAESMPSGDAPNTTVALPQFTQDSAITPVPTERTEDYVILKVAAEHANNVEMQLATVLGDKVPTVGKTDATTTFVVPASVAQQLSDTSGVSSYPDTPVSAVAEQTPVPSWGLDRVDALTTPLDDKYSWTNSGTGTIVYVIDTGVYSAHGDFGGRVVSGYTAIADGRGTEDCHGHGTHVAGTVAGRNYGVAKTATIVAVRVLDCTGSGYSSGVVAGINWVTANHPGGPAVINMSLGGGANSAIDSAVTDAVNAGIVVVVAAGNSSADACSYSPARVPGAITIGATDIRDARASYSNFGSCVDMWAPGTQITSAWISGNTATNTISGTSMASPHVAGLAARVLSMNPALTPTDVNARLVQKNSTATTPIVNLVETPQDTPTTTTTVPEPTTTVIDTTTTIVDATTTTVEATTTTIATTTSVPRTTTTTSPGATTTTIPPSTVPKQPKPGKGRKATSPKNFEMDWEMEDNRIELVASWKIQTTPDRYKIVCTKLALGEKAPVENEIEFDASSATKKDEGRTETTVLLVPNRPLRCELTAIIGNDVSEPSNPAIVPPAPRRGVTPPTSSSVPSSTTPTTEAPEPTTPRPVITMPKPGERPKPITSTTAPTTTTTVVTPTPTTSAPTTTVIQPTTTTVATPAPTTTAAAATQPSPRVTSPVTTPKAPPATTRGKRG